MLGLLLFLLLCCCWPSVLASVLLLQPSQLLLSALPKLASLCVSGFPPLVYASAVTGFPAVLGDPGDGVLLVILFCCCRRSYCCSIPRLASLISKDFFSRRPPCALMEFHAVAGVRAVEKFLLFAGISAAAGICCCRHPCYGWRLHVRWFSFWLSCCY
jgi:hypothetical protein